MEHGVVQKSIIRKIVVEISLSNFEYHTSKRGSKTRDSL